MMMGFGFLMMLAILAVPILLVVGLAVLLMRPLFSQFDPTGSLGPVMGATAPAQGRACAHCGARLQPDWIHCPQCGAPTGNGV